LIQCGIWPSVRSHPGWPRGPKSVLNQREQRVAVGDRMDGKHTSTSCLITLSFIRSHSQTAHSEAKHVPPSSSPWVSQSKSRLTSSASRGCTTSPTRFSAGESSETFERGVYFIPRHLEAAPGFRGISSRAVARTTPREVCDSLKPKQVIAQTRSVR
jgi:hypothetical protein